MSDQVQETKPQVPAEKTKRLESIDVLRGITIAGMVLVNNGAGPGTFEPLRHSAWNGLTPCDLVFPFFLFIMGVTTYLSLKKYKFHSSVALWKKIISRTLVIFFLSWAIHWVDYALKGHPWPDDFRYLGVLQRIAICYFITAVLALHIRRRLFPLIAFVLLVVYSVIILVGYGYYDDKYSILSVVDSTILGMNHLYRHGPIDPEGLLSTIPAVAHTMVGFYFGRLLSVYRHHHDRIMHLLMQGFVMLAVGWLLSYGLPINKRIWSPTFVMVTCGAAASAWALLMYAIDVKDGKKWFHGFHVFGVNSLAIYALSELAAIVFKHCGLTGHLYQAAETLLNHAGWASLVCAMFMVLLMWMVAWVLHKRKIYIKV